MSGDVHVWYFAYGSNLDPDTFDGWRQMRPSAARPARLADYDLVFDLPIGSGERGVANVIAKTGAALHGVAYRISHEEGKRLDVTEGVPDAYRRQEIQLETEAGTLSAFTYISPHGRDGRKPSERYMNLLLRGARHHGLPESWLFHLRSLDLAFDERLAQLELFGAPEPSSLIGG